MSLFDWDEANVRHIAAHDVSVEEAEQALTIAPLEFDAYEVRGEMRYEEFGRTASGRILKIVSVQRGERIRIVTAYDAPALAIRLYYESMI